MMRGTSQIVTPVHRGYNPRSQGLEPMKTLTGVPYHTLWDSNQWNPSPYPIDFGAQTCEAPACAGWVTLHFILYHLVEANQSTHQLLEMNLKYKPLPIQNSEDDWSQPHVEHNRIMLSWLGFISKH